MADGDVRLDDEYEFSDGTRVVLYAVENVEYPGGVNYRFTYVDPETGRNLLRYDNSRVIRHGIGAHHRHRGASVTPLDFDCLEEHLVQFREEVNRIRAQRR